MFYLRINSIGLRLTRQMINDSNSNLGVTLFSHVFYSKDSNEPSEDVPLNQTFIKQEHMNMYPNLVIYDRN